ETHEIGAPYGANVGRFVRQLSVAPHPIASEIGTDIEIGPERRQPRIAGLCDADERTWFWIGDAESQELVRPVARQDGEIALHEARCASACRSIEVAGSAGKPHVEAGFEWAAAGPSCSGGEHR